MFFLQFLPLCSQHVNGKLQGCMSVNVYVILWGSVTLLSYMYVLAFSPFTKAFQHILVNKLSYNCMTQYSITRRIVYCFALHTFLLMHYVYICMYVCLYVGIEQFLFKHSLFRPRNICVCVFFSESVLFDYEDISQFVCVQNMRMCMLVRVYICVFDLKCCFDFLLCHT